MWMNSPCNRVILNHLTPRARITSAMGSRMKATQWRWKNSLADLTATAAFCSTLLKSGSLYHLLQEHLVTSPTPGRFLLGLRRSAVISDENRARIGKPTILQRRSARENDQFAGHKIQNLSMGGRRHKLIRDFRFCKRSRLRKENSMD